MKKLFSNILASTLILSLSTACSSGTQSTTQTTPQQESQAQTTDTSTPTVTDTSPEPNSTPDPETDGTQHEPNTLNPEIAATYIQVIESIQDKYGIDPSYSHEEQKFQTGLWFAKLIDFDHDGIEELYLTYIDKSEFLNHSVVQEIWGYTVSDTDASVINVDTYSLDFILGGTADINTGTFLLPYEGKTLLVRYDYLSHRVGQTYEAILLDYNNGQLSVQESLYCKLNNLDLSDIVQLEYNINDTETNEKTDLTIYNHPLFTNINLHEEHTFNLAKNQYDLSQKEYLLKGYAWDYENCLPQLQAIVDNTPTD